MFENSNLTRDGSYTLAIVFLLIFGLIAYNFRDDMDRHKQIKRNKNKIAGMESESEGMHSGNPYANTAFRNGGAYLQSDMGPPGTVGFADERHNDGSEHFLGGNEPPVFYDIGDVRAARTTRGYNTGYVTDASGNPVYGADGNPIMASKSTQYMSTKDRNTMYGRNNTSTRTIQEQVAAADKIMRERGYTKNSSGTWVLQESMWSPVEEGFKSDEDLMYRM
jgi:hypothetical protein